MEETGSFCSGVLWPMPVVVGGVKPLPHLCMAPPAGLYAAAHTPGVLLILQGPPTKPILTPPPLPPRGAGVHRNGAMRARPEVFWLVHYV